MAYTLVYVIFFVYLCTLFSRSSPSYARQNYVLTVGTQGSSLSDSNIAMLAFESGFKGKNKV